MRERLPLLESHLNAFIPNILRVVRVVAFLLVVAAVLDAWRVADIGGWLTGPTGQAFIAAVLSAAAILLVTWLIWLAMSSWVEYRLTPNLGRAVGARERTPPQLLRNAVTHLAACGVGGGLPAAWGGGAGLLECSRPRRLAHRPDRPGLHRRRALGGRHPAGDLADLAGDVLLGRVPPQPQPRQGGRGARAHPAAASAQCRHHRAGDPRADAGAVAARPRHRAAAGRRRRHRAGRRVRCAEAGAGPHHRGLHPVPERHQNGKATCREREGPYE